MSDKRVNHPKVQLFTDQALDATGGTAPSATSAWYDTSGWTDKRVSWEVDSGGAIDIDIKMHISPLHYQVLTDLGTSVTTDEYESVDVVTTHTAAIMASIDSADVDELRRPYASTRFYVDNDSAAAVTAFNLWLEGWS
jgi:hypothetical protein